MDENLTTASKTLARWCYARGVDERVLAGGEHLLGRAVDQALGRRATPQLEHALWQQVAVLLRQRRQWDSAHQVTAPATAECLWCAIARPSCPQHAPCRCRVCSGPMHRSILEEGFDTHPCCDRTVTPGTYADLKYVAQLLGATPLPQPA